MTAFSRLVAPAWRRLATGPRRLPTALPTHVTHEHRMGLVATGLRRWRLPEPDWPGDQLTFALCDSGVCTVPKVPDQPTQKWSESVPLRPCPPRTMPIRFDSSLIWVCGVETLNGLHGLCS